MSTTLWSVPEVEETKTEQLPPPPETIYIADLDPTSEEFQTAKEKQEEGDREKTKRIQYKLKQEALKEEQEQLKGQLYGIIADWMRRVHDYTKNKSDYEKEMSFERYCSQYNHNHFRKQLDEIDITKFTDSADVNAIKVLRKIDYVLHRNDPELIYELLYDAWIMAKINYGHIKPKNTYALDYLANKI